MKKILTLFVAIALCMGLAVPALAAETVREATNYEGKIIFSNDATKEATVVAYDQWLAEENMPVDLYTVPVGTTITWELLDDELDPDPDVEVLMCGIMFSDGMITDPNFGFGGLASNTNTVTLTEPGCWKVTFWWDEHFSFTAYVNVVGDGAATPEPAPATPDPAPTTPDVYTVKAGDTMGKLALNYYGSYGYHVELTRLNAETLRKTNYILYVGMELVLPEKLGEVARLSPQVTGEGETLYTVKAGDTLSGIAKAVYGDMMKYQAIYERNADRLKDANTIYEGQVIILPAK